MTAPGAIPERSTSRYPGHYARTMDPQRLLEMFTDSQRIAPTSKNPETAQRRFDLAVEAYHQLSSLTLPGDIRASVRGVMATVAERFPVQVRLNEAMGLCARATKLKNLQRRLEWLDRARAVLADGLADPALAGASSLHEMHEQVVWEIARAEMPVVIGGRAGVRDSRYACCKYSNGRTQHPVIRSVSRALPKRRAQR